MTRQAASFNLAHSSLFSDVELAVLEYCAYNILNYLNKKNNNYHLKNTVHVGKNNS